MTRTELIKLIATYENPTSYDKIELIDRIATKRPISAGQNRVLCQIINDVLKPESAAVAVMTDHWSDEYAVIMFDTDGKSLQSLCYLNPIVKYNQSIYGITNNNNATVVTYEKGNLR